MCCWTALGNKRKPSTCTLAHSETYPHCTEGWQSLHHSPALMEAQGPVGYHGWVTNDVMVLPDDLLRCGASKDVQLHDATNDPAQWEDNVHSGYLPPDNDNVTALQASTSGCTI